ncbi:hypothetical protein D9M71_549750 [compost metagenome]
MLLQRLLRIVRDPHDETLQRCITGRFANLHHHNAVDAHAQYKQLAIHQYCGIGRNDRFGSDDRQHLQVAAGADMPFQRSQPHRDFQLRTLRFFQNVFDASPSLTGHTTGQVRRHQMLTQDCLVFATYIQLPAQPGKIFERNG